MMLDDAGNPIEEEVYSMEPKLNVKDFMAESIKICDIGEEMQWHSTLGTHGSVNGVFIPPLRSIVKGQSMGNLWQKKFVGLTVRGRRTTMSNYIYKLTMIDGVLPLANGELRDIVMASDGDGYEAVYNILRIVHPKLTDTKVEMKIPCQGISDTFAHHVKNIQSTIENEEIHGLVYTCYEGLEIVIGTLHPKFESALHHKTEMVFENKHDQVNSIPFELQMSNLGKTLGGWAPKLGLN
jgi:hypothetical protein